MRRRTLVSRSVKAAVPRRKRPEVLFRFKVLGSTVGFRPPRIIDLGKTLAGALPAIAVLVMALAAVYRQRSAERSTAYRSTYNDAMARLTANDPKPLADIVFGRLLRWSQTDFRTWNRYLDYLIQAGQTGRVVSLLEGLTPEESGGNAQFHLRLANLLLSDPESTEKKLLDAERHLRFVADMDDGPAGILAARKIALLQVKRGDLAAALKTLEPIMAESPAAGAEAIWLAWSGNRPFDPNATPRTLDRIERDLRAQRVPEPDTVLSKLRLLVISGRTAEAAEWFALQKTLSPEARSSIETEFAEMQLIASMKSSAEGNLPDWSKLEEVLKRKPNDPIWLAFVANIWAGPRRVGAEAARQWVQTRLDNDTASDFLLRQALVARSHQYEAFGKTPGDSQELRGLYRKFLKRYPRDAVAMNNLAVLIYKHEPENMAEALKLVTEADRLSPGEPTIRETLGQVLARLGQLDQARPILEKCLGPLPNEWGLHNTLMQIYDRQGERKLTDAHRAILANLPRPADSAAYEKLQLKPGQEVSNSLR